jgi:hypothetical protein
MTFSIRSLVPDDLPRLLALNNAAVPAVNELDAPALAALAERSHLAVAVVADGFRGQGLGQVLYDAIFGAARQELLAEVLCEVNLEPPNPGSLAFHDRLGFTEVGQLSTKGDTVVVSLLAASV